MFVFINNKKYETLNGLTLMQTCNNLGFEIPRFCYHEKLSIAGNCRMCLIEISRPKGPIKPKPAASCAISAIDNMFMHTTTILVKKARESVLEFLLINHPLDCPICDQGGECDLQDQTMIFGSDQGRFYDKKRATSDKDCGPLIKTSMTRCIHCTRCVRFGNEIAGVDFLGTTGRGFYTEIAPYINNFIYSEISANIIDLCPVGALTSKPYAFKARPWELRVVETIDIMDSICSNIRIDIRGIQIMRIMPRLNEDLNEEWITDKTRFCYDGLNKQRLSKPMIKLNNRLLNVSWKNVFLWLSVKLIKLKSTKFFGFTSSLTDLESIIVLKDFLNKNGSSFFAMEQNLSSDTDFDLPSSYSFSRRLKDIEDSDFCILFGFSPRLEMPLINIRLRKAIKLKNMFVALFGYTMNLTYKIYNISNNISDFLDFVEGKSLLCRKMLRSREPIIIQGDTFLYRKDNNGLININKMINNFVYKLNKYSYKFGYIANMCISKVGLVNSNEIGFYSKIQPLNFFETSKTYLFYLLNVSEKRLLSKISKAKHNIFSIFQGHIGNEISAISNAILPGSNFVEQKLSFLNLERRLQHTNFIKMPPFLARSDWSIIVALSLFIRKHFIYASTSELKLRLLQITPAIFNIQNKIQNRFLFLAGKNYSKSFFFNTSVSSSFFNYYDSDVISKSSQILSLISKKFIKNRNYYTIEI
jgi:NADH-quinone oxidoreductase subunit G